MGVTLKYLRDRIKLEGEFNLLDYPDRRIDDIINKTIANLGTKLADKTNSDNFNKIRIELNNSDLAYFFGYAVKRLAIDEEHFPNGIKDFIGTLTLEGEIEIGDKRHVTKIIEVSESDLLMSLRNFYFRPGLEETLTAIVCGAFLFGDKNITAVNASYLKRFPALTDDDDEVEITVENIETIIRSICDGVLRS